MDKEEIFIAQDENGVEREGFLINKLEIEGQEYVVYALSMNNDEDSIYVSKIIKKVSARSSEILYCGYLYLGLANKE